MIALHITHIKDFMNTLFQKDCFDPFLVQEVTISTYNTFHIHGRLLKDFYTAEEWADIESTGNNCSLWQHIKPFCFQIIRGKKTPLSFQFVFKLSAKDTEKLLSQSHINVDPSQVEGLLLTLRYKNDSLQCVTGTSLHIFTLDTTVSQAWDQTVLHFFHTHSLPYEML